MRSALITAATTASLVLAACSGMHVESKIEPGASFKGLETYSWLLLADSTGMVQMATNPLMRQRLTRAVDGQMAARGYARVDEDGDFLVTFYSFTQQKIQWDQFDPTTRDLYSFPIYRNEWQQGTLVLAAIDPNERKVLWLGWADDAVDPTRPDKAEKQLNEAVTKIMAEFPAEADPGRS
jgi:hypothetical protein